MCFRSGEEEEEVIHMGNAIMSFYSALIDLLGRCAPEMHVRLSYTATAAARDTAATHIYSLKSSHHSNGVQTCVVMYILSNN